MFRNLNENIGIIYVDYHHHHLLFYETQKKYGMLSLLRAFQSHNQVFRIQREYTVYAHTCFTFSQNSFGVSRIYAYR